MAIFNGYVKLPEGNQLRTGGHHPLGWQGLIEYGAGFPGPNTAGVNATFEMTSNRHSRDRQIIAHL